MVNTAIQRYYDTLLANSEDNFYDYLFALYDGTYTSLLEDNQFDSTTVAINPEDYLNNLNDMVNIRQEVTVNISYADVLPYLNDNTRILLETNADEADNDYEYENTFENLEYYGNYNYLIVGKHLLNKLRLNEGTKFECRMGLYNIHQATVIPEFITSYDDTTEVPELPISFTNTYYKLNKFKNSSYLLLNSEQNVIKSIPCMLCNIPYEYYSQAFRKTKSLYYDLNLQEYRFLNKNIEVVNGLIEDFATNGIMSPLCLGVNNNGKIVDVAQCNIGLMISLFFKFPTVPAILYYNIANHYTNSIPTIAEDTNSVNYANEAFEGHLIFGSPNKEGYVMNE